MAARKAQVPPAVPSTDLSTILAGERVYLNHKVFDDEVAHIIVHEYILKLGAETVEARRDATINLLNPSHPSYHNELHHNALLASDYPEVQQPLHLPYHWLTLCLHLGKRVAHEDVDPAEPFFVFPGSRQPLRAWVSLNVIKRHDEASPEVAHANTVLLMVRGGALMVKKRAQADVLIIDPGTKFYQVVKAEKIKHKRDHQRLAERDWVEDCSKNQLVAWKSEREIEEAPSDAESFASEDAKPTKRGPGRPAGRPRAEFSPAEDDFLCRYLAGFQPAGSWGSRPTYERMVERSGLFPVASAHPPQSWHGRFKNNSGIFTNRVLSYIQAGIDESLKTTAERKANRSPQEVQDEQILRRPPVSVEPQRTSASKSPTKKRTVETSAPQIKRNLVEPDGEEESIAPERSAGNGTQAPGSVAQPDVEMANGEANVNSAEPMLDDPEPVVPPMSQSGQQMHGDSIMVDQSLEHVPSDDPMGQVYDHQPSQQLDESLAEDRQMVGAETQVLLDEFAHVNAAVAAKEAARAQAQATANSRLQQLQADRSSADRIPSLPQSPRRTASPAPSTKRARPSEPRASSERRGEMPAPRSVARVPRVSHGSDGSGSHRVSVPVKLNFKVVGVTEDGSTEEEGDDDGQGARPHPHHRIHMSTQTPSPGSRGPRVSTSRKRSRLSQATPHHHQTPDTVYATPEVPPRPPVPPPSISPAVKSRASPRPLTRSEHDAAILHGQVVAKEKTDQYKAHIRRLCSRYNDGPVTVIKAVDLVKQEGELKMSWEEVERRLDVHYEYREQEQED